MYYINKLYFLFLEIYIFSDGFFFWYYDCLCDNGKVGVLLKY